MAAAIKNAFKVAVIIDSCKTPEISHSVLAVWQQLSDHMLHSKTLQSHSQKWAADVSLWCLWTLRKCLSKNFVCMVFMQGAPFKLKNARNKAETARGRVCRKALIYFKVSPRRCKTHVDSFPPAFLLYSNSGSGLQKWEGCSWCKHAATHEDAKRSQLRKE